ncbi:MAG: WYL domain-containing protein [Clostridia bacterium]
MPKNSNQKFKILYLMKIMLELTDDRHSLSLAEILSLLSEYNVTAERKSIYDDFEVLRLYGINIEQKRDKTTEYYVADRTFEMPELKLLVDAVQSSRFITHKKSSELIHKIEGFASKYEARQLQRQVYVTNRIKTMNESIYYTVDYIHNAITYNSKIKFQYYDWNEKKKKQLRHDGLFYTVSPWALTWDNENYYLIAFDSQSKTIKHYRVDKMLSISITNEKREGSDIFNGFDMALYSKKVFGMYGGKDELVLLRCQNRMASIIIDRFGKDVTFRDYDDKHFEIVVNIAISPLFLTWLMNFGDGIKIISPENVISEFKKIAQNALAQYNL